jgi:hypothetical protein
MTETGQAERWRRGWHTAANSAAVAPGPVGLPKGLFVSNKRIAFIVLGGLALICTSGCMRTVDEVKAGFEGAEGIVTPYAGESLASYSNFELEINNDIGDHLPPRFTAYLRQEFAKRMAEKQIPQDPRGKTAVVSVEIRYFELQGTYGKMMARVEEVIARGKIVDKKSGHVLGTADLVGRTTEYVAAGTQKKAEGLAKAIVEWIQMRYPGGKR